MTANYNITNNNPIQNQLPPPPQRIEAHYGAPLEPCHLQRATVEDLLRIAELNRDRAVMWARKFRAMIALSGRWRTSGGNLEVERRVRDSIDKDVSTVRLEDIRKITPDTEARANTMLSRTRPCALNTG